jgi:hypothetical protein
MLGTSHIFGTRSATEEVSMSTARRTAYPMTSRSHSPVIAFPTNGLKQRSDLGPLNSPSSSTVFDRLYDEYLPFRLYADHMLGASAAQLARQFALSEHWVVERIEAIRLCIGRQVRLNLLEPLEQADTAH